MQERSVELHVSPHTALGQVLENVRSFFLIGRKYQVKVFKSANLFCLIFQTLLILEYEAPFHYELMMEYITQCL